jgi:FAD/FMN-containing dehydrogenase
VHTERLIQELRRIVGPSHVLVDPALRATYETDWTGRFHGEALAVVRPADTEQVAAVVRACHGAGIAIIPQGGNTGMVGGGVPGRGVRAGVVVLSLVRLAALEPVDTDEAAVVAGSGVTLARLADHARGAGLEFAVDLGSRDSATIGGMVATNAGGIHVLRYGSMRAQLLGIEAVLADGSVVRRLHAPRKDNTGYHFPSLLAGSEGTLGIITAARLRLVPWLDRRVVAVLGLAGVGDAVRIGARLRHTLPALHAVELYPARGLELVVRHRSATPPFATPCPVYLVVEAADTADPEPALVDALAAIDGILETAIAADATARDRLWFPREAITEALAAEALARGVVPHKMDVALPVGRLAEFDELLPVEVEAACPGAWSIAFGHVLDGNLHVNVLGPEPLDETPDEAVLGLALRLGGTISAEHGVGVVKARWLDLDRAPGDLAAMRAIKRALDPDRIMNPGVLLV